MALTHEVKVDGLKERGDWRAVQSILEMLRQYFPDVILAGGAPRDWYYGNPVKDYDFFAKLDDHQFEKLNKNLDITPSMSIEYEDSHFLTYNFSLHGLSCQLILVVDKTALEHVEEFPVNVSQCYLDGDVIRCSKEFTYFHKYGALLFDAYCNGNYIDKIVLKFSHHEKLSGYYFDKVRFLNEHFQWGYSKKSCKETGRQVYERQEHHNDHPNAYNHMIEHKIEDRPLMAAGW